jgi:glucose-1-phosphate adenylyltransferase
VNRADDVARGYTVSDGGITVVGKGVTIAPV